MALQVSDDEILVDERLFRRLIPKWLDRHGRPNAAPRRRAARAFIRALRDAVSWQENGVAPAADPVEGEGEVIKESPVSTNSAPAIATAIQAPPPTGVAPLARASGPRQIRNWTLDTEAGLAMEVTLPPVALLTKKHLAKIKKYVAALEMEAAVSWDDADEADPS